MRAPKGLWEALGAEFLTAFGEPETREQRVQTHPVTGFPQYSMEYTEVRG
ncbi:MAG TPA: hypothetical protein VN948_12775 [Terriglobales bacterium]|nr:hypothetical protein [Terriglobales bacterium]